MVVLLEQQMYCECLYLWWC